MKLIDLTHSLFEESSVHPGKTPFTRKTFEMGKAKAQVSDIHLSSGIGTHMDAPSHFFKNGKSIDQIPLEKCIGQAAVLHMKDFVKANPDYEISVGDLEEWEERYGRIPERSIVLAHTGWDRYYQKEDFCLVDSSGICHYPGFSASGAEFLAKRNIQGVGIDTLSIDPGCKTDGPSHQIFLKKEIFIVELLTNLEKLPPLGATVYILPMKIKGAPEAPVRAMAILN